MEIGLNVYTLKNGVSYTLCIEFLFGDLALGAKANISVNKSTSTGVTITNTNSRAFQHLYTDNSGNDKTIIYHRLITTFYKSIGNPHILRINVKIPQRGSDLSSYPSQYNKVYIIAYGVIGVSFDINANEVYDYHTAFDIKPTEVVYNVDLDMNRKNILNIRLFGKKSFTLCVVMQLWLNRNMYIKTFMRDGADEMPHLIYDKTTQKLKLQTNGLTGSTNETSITLLNTLNGKRVVFWLTKKGTGGNFTVKASISNYSGTLTISSELASQSNYTFEISSEDTKIYRIMYSPNFYDIGSHEFHTIIMQEKLKGSHIL